MKSTGYNEVHASLDLASVADAIGFHESILTHLETVRDPPDTITRLRGVVFRTSH
jgi:hypothetical protein